MNKSKPEPEEAGPEKPKAELEPEESKQEKPEPESELKIAALKGAKPASFPSYFPPMLASLAESPFSRDGWIYEPKMDGMRCIAFVNGDQVKLLSRRGQDITAQYPALCAALPRLCKKTIVLDGEIIALNHDGRPSFQLLQKRMNLLKVSDIARADARIPVHYFVFDTIFANGYNLAACPLKIRKLVLQDNLIESDAVVLLKFFQEDGKVAYKACIENGFEGIVAKRENSPYETGKRSPYWVKVKGQKSAEFVVGGYSPGQGSRSSTFGSLALGYYNDDAELLYAGSVGSGFDGVMLSDLLRRMEALKTDKCPFKQKPEDKKDSIWLLPEIVAEIKFMDWTEEMHLRNPVFLHLRHDIEASDVKLIHSINSQQSSSTSNSLEIRDNYQKAKNSVHVLPEQQDLNLKDLNLKDLNLKDLNLKDLNLKHWHAEADSVIAQLGGRDKNMKISVEHESISLTNLDKILFPELPGCPKITKRDYLKTVAFLSPYLLSYLENRPLTMIRAPSGMRSNYSFYQKHWNLDIPDFIETVHTSSEDPARKDQLLCNNMAALIYLTQHNILEYHCSLSRVPPPAERVLLADGNIDLSSYELPDFLVFDIDVHKEKEEKGGVEYLDKDAFKRAAQAARFLQETLLQLKLKPYLKTSGRNGLHVFIPLVRDLKFDEIRTLAETIARHVENDHLQEISTSAVAARKAGKVFLDYQANTKGKTLAAPYTCRLTATASVSTPIEWDELESIYPEDLNQHSIRDRIRHKGDIWKQIMASAADLSRVFNTRQKS